MILLPSDQWEIKTTVSTGRGIFATKSIAPGTVIGDYIGEVIKTVDFPSDSSTNGLYLMYYDDYTSIYPTSLSEAGIHLINHACFPNTSLYIYHGHTLFFTLRHINPGEELTTSYMLGPENYCNPCPHVCKCGNSECRGTMHLSEKNFDIWDSFSQTQAKQTKRLKVEYGKVLPRLASYPLSIPGYEKYNQILSSLT